MKTVYVRTKTKDEARKRAEWLYMILRDCTPVIADLHTSKAQVVTESMVIKYVPENYTMDGIRCDIAIGFGQLGKIIATENTCDNLMDERELAKYIVDNETISENENIECRRQSQRLNRMQQYTLRKTRKLQIWHHQRTQSDCRLKETHTRPCMNSYSTD